jgi:murein L,D-transpeptidase YcbB/YkuD
MPPLLLLVMACQSFRDQPQMTEGALKAVLTLDTTHFDHYPLHSRASVKVFYKRHGALYWTRDGAVTAAADSLLLFIQRAEALGLLPGDYHSHELIALRRDTVSSDRHSRFDILLTDAYLTVANHIRNGRLDPLSLARRELSEVPEPALIAMLENVHASSVKEALSSLEPNAQQYKDLKRLMPGPVDKHDSIQRQGAITIALNMERLRWQRKNHDRCVVVNIPAFVLRVLENDSIWLETKVIVGKRDTPTPVMESVIRSFIIYPYWHAPYSITTKEILPALQEDASYLRKNNFEVLNKAGQVILADTIQWDRYSARYFPYVLRQREGSENSMGIIKFIFANNYGVYLHDTNSKRLYSRERRDLSHGCVRVNDAVGLAHYLVREDDIYVSPEDLDQYLSLQQRLTITLRKPIALRLEYFTAEANDGEVRFYDDIYKKDSLMMRALYPETAEQFFSTSSTGL